MLKKLRKDQLRRFSMMLFSLMTFFSLMAVTASLSLAAEKPYPNRPINMVVGFSPGGSSDLGSKIIADKMSEILGQPIISIYKPGGFGALACSLVKGTKPDGYTILIVGSSMFLPPEIKKLDFNFEDFKYIGFYSKVPYFFSVRAESKWKTLKDFVKEAIGNPGKVTFGSTSPPVGGYLVAQLFSSVAKIKMAHVPFKSCGEAMAALLGGHIDSYSCVGVGAISEPNIVRTLAIAEEKRLEIYPNIPTFLELGFPVIYAADHGIAVPKETSEGAVNKLSDALKTVMIQHSKEIGEKLRTVDLFPDYIDSHGSFNRVKTTHETIRKLTKELTPDPK